MVEVYFCWVLGWIGVFEGWVVLFICYWIRGLVVFCKVVERIVIISRVVWDLGVEGILLCGFL